MGDLGKTAVNDTSLDESSVTDRANKGPRSWGKRP